MLRSLEDVHSSRKEFLRVSQLQQFNTLREQQFTLTSLDEDTDQQSNGLQNFQRYMTHGGGMLQENEGGLSDDEDSSNGDEEDTLQEDDFRIFQDIKIAADDVVIVASFKLPISLDRDPSAPLGWKVRNSRSLLYPTMFKLREQSRMVKILWIGWPGVIPESAEEQQQITDLLRDYGCIPAFFDAETIEQYLYYHETVLRPLFHNFKGLNDFEYLGK